MDTFARCWHTLPSGELAAIAGLWVALIFGAASDPTPQVEAEPSSRSSEAFVSTANTVAPKAFDLTTVRYRASHRHLLGELTCEPQGAHHTLMHPVCHEPLHQGRTNTPPTVIAGEVAEGGRVTRWLGPVEQIRSQLNLDAQHYPTAAVLALIALETKGDPWCRKFSRSSYYGLLQMGAAAARDIGMKRRGRRTTRPLHGDGELSLELFYRYQRRYGYLVRDEHGKISERMALLWKMGPGSMKTIRQLLDEGKPLEEAVSTAARRHKVWRADAYLERFRHYHSYYLRWLEEHHEGS